MRKQYFIFLLITSLISGCNTFDVENPDSSALLQSQEKLAVSYSVSSEDLADMIQYRVNSSQTKSDNETISYEVIPYGLEGTETLMYIVNYSSGRWEIISADKRTPVVLASGDGAFSTDDDSHGSTLYLRMMAESILELKQNKSDSIDENVLLWTEATGKPICMHDVATKAVVNYTYVLGSDSEVDVEEHVSPLLYTQWGQSGYDDMYNYYCPYKTDSTGVSIGVRASAGCVVVAGAQVLHYLYKTLGANIYMPNTASCSGVVGDYVQEFSKSCNMYYIRDILLNKEERKIYPHRKTYTRIFMAWIGSKIQVRYENDGTYSSVARLADVFDFYNLGFDYKDCQNRCDYDLIAENILGGSPVIIGAHHVVTKSDSPETEGHAWVIDGYKRTLTDRDIYCYRSSVELTEEEVAALTMNDCNFVFNSRTTKEEFNMNWGWSGLHDGWFLASSDAWNVSGSPYNMNIRLMYNFTKN